MNDCYNWTIEFRLKSDCKRSRSDKFNWMKYSINHKMIWKLRDEWSCESESFVKYTAIVHDRCKNFSIYFKSIAELSANKTWKCEQTLQHVCIQRSTWSQQLYESEFQCTMWLPCWHNSWTLLLQHNVRLKWLKLHNQLNSISWRKLWIQFRQSDNRRMSNIEIHRLLNAYHKSETLSMQYVNNWFALMNICLNLFKNRCFDLMFSLQ